MKLNSFKFQDGKVFWLPEYPERIDHACTQLPDHDCPICSIYTQDAFNSLASAIEVAPEDVNDFKLLWERTYKGVPMSGEVYSAECEMEIEYQYQILVNTINTIWRKMAKTIWNTWIGEKREVARLKPKDEFPAANSHDMKEGLK